MCCLVLVSSPTVVVSVLLSCRSQRRAIPPFVPAIVSGGDTRYFDVYSQSLDPGVASRWAKVRAAVRTNPTDFSDF